jgi:hypothetical protein
MRRCAALALFLVASAAGAGDKPSVRPLDLKAVKLTHAGNAPEAAVAGFPEELAKVKALADAAGRDAVAKQVDFAKEKVVVFAWQGSGGDRLVPELKTDGGKVIAVFTYSPGATDDLRPHGFAFSIPKDAVAEVKK